MKLNSKSDIYKWAFQENNEKTENRPINKIDELLKTDKEILESQEAKDSASLKVIQLNDLNFSSKNK